MAKLEYYPTLKDKRAFFRRNREADGHFQIDHADQFSTWYRAMKKLISADPLGNFFRGTGEARFKLYNSAQRFWMQNNLTELEAISQPLSYIQMVQNMVNEAKNQELFKRVFDYYGLTPEQTDFPILSILQHYGAPTPLMDWTYNLDVALYFAVEQSRHFEREGDIQNYMAVYRIVKADSSAFIKSNLQAVSGNVFPSITYLCNGWPGTIYYISDFEVKDQRRIKPLTTYYNLNILSQQGLFIFNPFEKDPLESIASSKRPKARIICYNINKDLAEMIKLTIDKSGINQAFIYPELKTYAGAILSRYLRGLV
jgi:FRG domain